MLLEVRLVSPSAWKHDSTGTAISLLVSIALEPLVTNLVSLGLLIETALGVLNIMDQREMPGKWKTQTLISAEINSPPG